MIKNIKYRLKTTALIISYLKPVIKNLAAIRNVRIVNVWVYVVVWGAYVVDGGAAAAVAVAVL